MPRPFMPLTFGMGYMSKWGTCTPFSTRLLAVHWLKKSFSSKVKDMNDRGIMKTFHICARQKWGTCTPFITRFFYF